MNAHTSSEVSAPPSERPFAMQRLDQLLARAIAQSQSRGRERASDPFRGLHIGPADVAKSLNSKSGRPCLLPMATRGRAPGSAQASDLWSEEKLARGADSVREAPRMRRRPAAPLGRVERNFFEFQSYSQTNARAPPSAGWRSSPAGPMRAIIKE